MYLRDGCVLLRETDGKQAMIAMFPEHTDLIRNGVGSDGDVDKGKGFYCYYQAAEVAYESPGPVVSVSARLESSTKALNRLQAELRRQKLTPVVTRVRNANAQGGAVDRVCIEGAEHLNCRLVLQNASLAIVAASAGKWIATEKGERKLAALIATRSIQRLAKG